MTVSKSDNTMLQHNESSSNNYLQNNYLPVELKKKKKIGGENDRKTKIVFVRPLLLVSLQ